MVVGQQDNRPHAQQSAQKNVRLCFHFGIFASLAIPVSLPFAFLACKNAAIQSGDPRTGNTTVAPAPAQATLPATQGTVLPPNPLTGQTPSALDASPQGAQTAAQTVCASAPGSAERTAALTVIENYTLGSQPWNASTAASSPSACVNALKLAAVYVNLVSGVPAGTILGQAVQETGFCKSDLARQAFNFHGMKAHVPIASFTYWKGEKFRKASTESATGEGNLQVSDFMKFAHADHGFYALAERLLIPTLPYVSCFPSRDSSETFMRCIGKAWAVHTTYAQVVLQHRTQYTLAGCELKKKEWKLKGKWIGK